MDTEDGFDEPIDSANGQSIQRREYLKLAATATGLTVTGATQSVNVRAASDGYGEGGYGEGPYGGSGSFSVTSMDATNIGETAATLNGSLEDLDGADSADCAFEYREAGTDEWVVTSAQTLTELGTVSADVDSLSAGATYEFRATASASDGATDTGTTKQFTTPSSTDNAAPSIDNYEVSEAGSPNPHIKITADWSVSDADGNIDTVVVRVKGTDDTLADASVTDISGDSASGSETIEVRHVDGETFVVTLTVIDTDGESVSKSKFVTE